MGVWTFVGELVCCVYLVASGCDGTDVLLFGAVCVGWDEVSGDKLCVCVCVHVCLCM